MKKIIVALIGLAIAMPSVFAATWYVKSDGNDANSGATWALAKKTIQAGVDVASGGDTVLVTNGTYVLTNQISISKSITVQSVNGASSTIVDGNYPVTINRCFSVSHHNATLDGFTIKNGHLASGVIGGGGGVANCGMVKNCTISGNTADAGHGGGVYNHNGMVRNCIVYYNENGDFYGDVPQYSCVPGLSGNGNISTEPCFYDPGTGYGNNHTGGDFRLKPISPCINAGINQSWMTGAVDLDNNPRIINGIVDMGAYEYTGTPSAPIDVNATDGTFADKVRVTWGGVTDATYF